MCMSPQKIQLFSTSPQSGAVPREDYIKKVIPVARWSEEYGYEGILVYTDKELLTRTSPLTFEGHFYTVSNLMLKPELPVSLVPGIFVSGSSEAGMEAARALGGHTGKG